MSSGKKAFSKVAWVIEKINETLLLIAVSVMFLLVFTNVIGRYFFSYSISWAQELSRYLMISAAFLGMGLAMKQNLHSSFNIFQDLFPTALRRGIRAIVSIIILLMMGLLLVLGFQYAMAYRNNLTEVLRWPVGYWYLVIPTGAFLFIFHFSCHLKEYITRSKDADIEAEIAAGEQMMKDSEFMRVVEDYEATVKAEGEEKN